MSKISCCLPWIHLATHPNGAASLCCQAKLDDASGFAKTDGKMLNLENRKVIDILNSDSYVDVRNKMINNIEPSTCSRCYDAERNNEWSKRLFENERFKWNPNNLNGYVSEGNLEFIELRLGNVCNLACVTCNSISSSKWIKDEIKIAEKLKWYKDITYIETKNHRWFENEIFYEELAEKNPSLKKIYINGGEPFLIKAHKRLLQKLIETNRSTDIDLEYSTNVTIKPEEYIDLFKEFKSVTIMLSVDDIGERNDWLRWPSNWGNIEENIQWYLKNRLDNMKLILCQTVSCLNVFYLDEMMRYCKQKNLNYTANFVYSPSIFSAKSLNDFQKIEIKNKYQGYDLSQLHSWLELTFDSESKKRLDEFVDELDNIRNTKIASLYYR